MLNLRGGLEITLLGSLIGCLAFFNFVYYMQRKGISLDMGSVDSMDYFMATTLSYATIVYCQFLNILQRRSERSSLFNRNFFSNKILLNSILVSIVLVSLAIYGPYISQFLSFGPIGVQDWACILGATGIYLLTFEAIKFFKRHKHATQG